MVVQQIGWDGDSAVRVYKLNKFDKFNKLKTLIILIHVRVWAIGLTSCFVLFIHRVLRTIRAE